MKSVFWRRAGRAVVVGAGVLLALVAVGWGLDRLSPLPAITPNGAQVVVDRNGVALRAYPSRDGIWRYPVTVEAVSPNYVQALLGYEDRWFYWHPGVNPFALGRAAWQWITAGRIVSGGSTLTMQVARLVDPSLGVDGSRSIRVKIKQIWRAMQLEARYSKDEILALYMTYAPMGGIVEGVEMGAQQWLGKSARSLSDAEAAMLAALPQQPSRLRPDRHPALAQVARDKVIRRLRDQGDWSHARWADAVSETISALPLRSRWLAPLAAQRVFNASSGEPIVETLLDVELQSTIESMVLDRAALLPPRVSMAVLVMENDTLAVRAYVGSADFTDTQRGAHVDMIRAQRSPGSTLKPFLYAQALDEGLVHSESMLLDAPLSFGGYAPGNFQAAFAGPVSVADALARSLNVPAVDLLNRVGSAQFSSRLMAGGLPVTLPAGAEPNLSLILGGGGTTLEGLVGAYRSLAREGLSGRPRLVPGDPVIESRMMSAGAAWIVRDILEGGGHPDRPFVDTGRAGRRLAWKTGTSFGFRDAWTLGVTDAWTIGVWVGRPDGTPNPGFFGANIAAPLARDIALALPESPGTVRAKPATVEAALTCWPLGVRWQPDRAAQCASRRAAWILDGTVPPTFPEYAQRVDRPIRLIGVRSNEVLRPTPGSNEVNISLNVEQAQGDVWWLLNGEVLGETPARQSFTVSLSRNGRYTLTVMDKQGRHDSVDLEITGVTR